jgi:hypothetical protein
MRWIETPCAQAHLSWRPENIFLYELALVARGFRDVCSHAAIDTGTECYNWISCGSRKGLAYGERGAEVGGTFLLRMTGTWCA